MGSRSSINGGANFSQVSTGIPSTATVTSTTASKSGASTTVLAGTSRGVYVSTDVLTSFPGHWNATKLTSPAIASMNTDSNSTPPVDYAGSYFEGIFETTDGFNTFIAPNLNLSGATVGAIDHGNSTTPSTIWAGVTSLQQAYVDQNTTGYNGTFDQTTLINQPGSIRALKNQQAGELLEFHPVVAELNSTGTQLTFSTYLASSSWDTPGGIAIDLNRLEHLCGGYDLRLRFPDRRTDAFRYRLRWILEWLCFTDWATARSDGDRDRHPRWDADLDGDPHSDADSDSYSDIDADRRQDLGAVDADGETSRHRNQREFDSQIRHQEHREERGPHRKHLAGESTRETGSS